VQYVHTAFTADKAEQLQIGSINRGKCTLIAQDFDCLFSGRDPNNPATLYQSKVGRPESFPVINLTGNFAQQVNVGSPANPIMAITTINGELISMNLNNIFIVQLWNGQMQQPLRSLSSRGLFSNWACVRARTPSGFWPMTASTAGPAARARRYRNPVEYLFRNLTVSGLAPIDMTLAAKFSMVFARGQLFSSTSTPRASITGCVTKFRPGAGMSRTSSTQ